MVLFYLQVSKIGIKGYRIADTFSNTIFIYLKIMLATFGFLYVDDMQTIPLKYDLCLLRVCRFSPEYYAFWFFLGRFVRLSVPSTMTY